MYYIHIHWRLIVVSNIPPCDALVQGSWLADDTAIIGWKNHDVINIAPPVTGLLRAAPPESSVACENVPPCQNVPRAPHPSLILALTRLLKGLRGWYCSQSKLDHHLSLWVHATHRQSSNNIIFVEYRKPQITSDWDSFAWYRHRTRNFHFLK